jgi:AcrR family transcriptional regulator
MMYLESVPVKDESGGRLSRKEAQARTRERLLDAAEVAFAAEGFGGASLDRIAESAQLTRGAVYSNFADKTDLFVAVLDRDLERRRVEIFESMQASADPASFVAALRETEQEQARSPGVPRSLLLREEFRLFALRNPDAATRLAQHERRLRDYYAQAARHLLGQLGVEPPADPRVLAATIFAIDSGLYRQHWVDPEDVPATAFADALQLLLDAAVALGRSRSDGRGSEEPVSPEG